MDGDLGGCVFVGIVRQQLRNRVCVLEFPALDQLRNRHRGEHLVHGAQAVAVGGDWPGNPDRATKFPQRMLVDYVRVYGRK